MECFWYHELFQCHKISNTYEILVPKCENVQEMISETAKTEMALNRKFLIKIIECLQFLGCQGIAIQGSTDEESNFVQLLRLRCKDSKDLAKWMERKTDRYTRHDIQNGILKLMSNSVILQLVNDIRSRQCNFLSLIADEYTDISNLEQLTTCFRWIGAHLDSHEDFVGFYHIPNRVPSTIESVLKDVLIRLQLSLNECRGQCYDGASNMLGRKSDVVTRIKEIQPKADATHCHCHSLSLSMKDTTKGSKILTDAMEITKEIVQFYKAVA